MKRREFTLDFPIDPRSLFKIAEHFAHEEGTCLLFSGTTYETAQRSYLFLFPYETILIHSEMQQRTQINGKCLEVSEANPWDAMKKLGHDMGKGESAYPEWVGFFGYEMGAYSDEDIIVSHFQASTPEAYWQKCALTLILDHKTDTAVVSLVEDIENCLISESHREWYQRLKGAKGWKDLLESSHFKEKKHSQLAFGSISNTKESYIDHILLAQKYIRSGDVYQINLSQQFEFFGESDPFQIFKRLAELNPAPFFAYFYLKDFSIISSSPERFLQKKKDILETRPIKGTAPRGKTVHADELLKAKLLSSAKERAELTMITDLMRNDLGKISEIGSVEAPLICGCEAYDNVFHLYSIVRSRLPKGYHPVDVVRACFPGGSITGCPKLRAMELISALEKRPRGVYTGAIGYFSYNGDFDFNLAIRTLVATKDKINVQLGGGIVIDSDPEKEYEETHHKGQTIFTILQN